MTRWLCPLLSVTALAFMPHEHAVAQGAVELRAGGVTMLSHRAAMFEGNVGTASGIMPGGELLVRLRYGGLAARLFGGAFSADSGSEAVGRVSAADVQLLVGPRFLTADIGYGRRAFSGAFGDRSWPFARFGLRSTLAIGASGLSAEFSLAVYAGLGGGDGAGKGSGREAETHLVFTPARMPLYVGLGYRHERFTVSSPVDIRPEEVTGIVLAVGMRLRS